MQSSGPMRLVDLFPGKDGDGKKVEGVGGGARTPPLYGGFPSPSASEISRSQKIDEKVFLRTVSAAKKWCSDEVKTFPAELACMHLFDPKN